jgi:cold shock CspA family protein/ribosome-associated translation inhibitor RaiA
METPIQIEFQGMEPVEHVRSAIAKHVTDLAGRFGRITAGRVVVKSPGGHQRTGGHYEVNIHLALPSGREVDIDRTAKADERHADLSFVVNDAFKRARRRLQDHVRRMQGQVKTHAERPIGTVTRLKAEQGYGFLETKDGREIYFHQNSVLDGKFSQLAAGTRVLFAEELGEKGPQASTVDILGKHALRQ